MTMKTAPRAPSLAPKPASKLESGRLGPEGLAAACLLALGAGMLGVAQEGGAAAGWAPLAAAGLGLAAGLAGLAGLWRRNRAPPQPLPAPPMPDGSTEAIAALLRTLTAEMLRLKRDGAEVTRTLSRAGEAGGRMAEAAATATSRLEESAESSAIAARALALLPGLADAQAHRIEQMSARAERALSVFPEGMAARLDRLPQEVTVALAAPLDASINAAEARLAARLAPHPAEDQATTTRLAGVAQRLERAGTAMVGLGEILPQRLDQVAATLESRLDAAMPPLLARLEALARPLEQASTTLLADLSSLAAQAEAIGTAAATMRMQAEAAPDTAAADSLRAGIARLDATAAQLAAAGEAVTTQMAAQIGVATAALGLQADRIGDSLPSLDTRLAESAVRIDEATEALRQEASSLGLMAPALESQAQIATAGIGAATAALHQEATRLETLGRSAEAHLRTLDAAQPLLEAAMQGLAVSTGALDDVGQRLRPATEALAHLAGQLPQTCAALERASEAPARAADRLASAAQALEKVARQPTEPEPAALLAPLRAGAPEPVVEPAPATPLARSIASSILGSLATKEEPAIVATLLRLDGIGNDVEALLRGTEGMVAGTDAPAMSHRLAQHAPELLETLDQTIRSLQSVATAIAVAADRGLLENRGATRHGMTG
ncbi:hypothetical protein [Falsiroseomonas sp. E2-1-a20]|uniref:hypothetical protein n=1 Tax=Falsiroseomonas sp. E2-1-a20 TaxID=3239300 RepID=UPI003F338435